MSGPDGDRPLRTVIVMAKAPVAGSVKTRLCPPCLPGEAAAVAEAALSDTLAAVAAADADRRLLALDGAPGEWLVDDVEVVAQRGSGLAERLADAVSRVPYGHVIVIGMDTPQCTPGMLDGAFAALSGHDAALGLSTDGGWWLLALRSPCTGVFDGVPMSTDVTGAMQLARLRELGLSTATLPVMTDVDTYAAAVEVASGVPASRFARAVDAVARRRGRSLGAYPQPSVGTSASTVH